MVHLPQGKFVVRNEPLCQPDQYLFVLIANHRDTILKLLLDGARELGNIVCSHIRALLNELHTLRRRPESTSAASTSQSAQAGTSSEDADTEAVDRTKGFLMVISSF